MAFTSYNTKVIYKEFEGDPSGPIDITGEFRLLGALKTVPAPMSPPNNVESTTLLDNAQTFKRGIFTTDTKEFTGNYEREDAKRIGALVDKQVLLVQLYGNDGVGNEGKFAYVAQVSITVSDVGGNDEIVECTISAIPNTVPVDCTDDITIVDNGDKTFAVTKAGEP